MVEQVTGYGTFSNFHELRAAVKERERNHQSLAGGAEILEGTQRVWRKIKKGENVIVIQALQRVAPGYRIAVAVSDNGGMMDEIIEVVCHTDDPKPEAAF